MRPKIVPVGDGRCPVPVHATATNNERLRSPKGLAGWQGGRSLVLRARSRGVVRPLLPVGGKRGLQLLPAPGGVGGGGARCRLRDGRAVARCQGGRSYGSAVRARSRRRDARPS